MHWGGKLLFSTPNIATLQNRIKLLVGICPLQPAENQMKQGWVHRHGHIREYTMKEVLSLLERCGFAIIRRGYLSPPPPTKLPQSKSQLVQQTYRLTCLIYPHSDQLSALNVPSDVENHLRLAREGKISSRLTCWKLA